MEVNATGKYRIAPTPGDYVVDITGAGIDHAGDVPGRITLPSGETGVVESAVDSGIR